MYLALKENKTMNNKTKTNHRPAKNPQPNNKKKNIGSTEVFSSSTFMVML